MLRPGGGGAEVANKARREDATAAARIAAGEQRAPATKALRARRTHTAAGVARAVVAAVVGRTRAELARRSSIRATITRTQKKMRAARHARN